MQSPKKQAQNTGLKFRPPSYSQYYSASRKQYSAKTRTSSSTRRIKLHVIQQRDRSCAKKITIRAYIFPNFHCTANSTSNIHIKQNWSTIKLKCILSFPCLHLYNEYFPLTIILDLNLLLPLPFFPNSNSLNPCLSLLCELFNHCILLDSLNASRHISNRLQASSQHVECSSRNFKMQENYNHFLQPLLRHLHGTLLNYKPSMSYKISCCNISSRNYDRIDIQHHRVVLCKQI